jgi:hypothetical protein
MQGPEERLNEYPFIKKAINRTVNLVNEHCGFTVIGTCMRGVMKDTSGSEAVDIMSTKPTYHLCYVMPTDLTYLDNEELNAARYRYPRPLQQQQQAPGNEQQQQPEEQHDRNSQQQQQSRSNEQLEASTSGRRGGQPVQGTSGSTNTASTRTSTRRS